MVKKVKLLQADDHPMFRMITYQVVNLLADEVIFLEADSAEMALSILKLHNDIDLILLDLVMPGMEKLAGFYSIRVLYPNTPIVIFSGSTDFEDMKAVLDNGAVGYVPKSATKEIVLSAFHLVLAGGIYRPEEFYRLVKQEETRRLFTKRQLEVLKLMEKGLCNKEIAIQLNLSEGTVKQHVANVFKILGVHSRIEAVVKVK